MSELAQISERKISQTDLAYGRLKAMILSGELSPTTQVDANRLAETLELGRTPIREALLRLKTEGIVTILPKRGVQVVSLSADEIMEIYQVISAIETEAARLLALSGPAPAKLSPLKAAVTGMEEAARAQDPEAWTQADEEFHRQLLKLNPNRRLQDVGLLHRDLAQRAHFVALRLLRPEQLAKSAKQHKRLIKLLLSGDGAAAADTHQVQRDRGAKMLVGVLRQYGLRQL